MPRCAATTRATHQGSIRVATIRPERAARFTDRAAAYRAAARVRALGGVPKRAVRVMSQDGWATLAIPLALVERHASIHAVVWSEGGLPDWPAHHDER